MSSSLGAKDIIFIVAVCPVPTMILCMLNKHLLNYTSFPNHKVDSKYSMSIIGGIPAAWLLRPTQSEQRCLKKPPKDKMGVKNYGMFT